MKREAGPYDALPEDRLAIPAESDVTRLGPCDGQVNRGSNPRHECEEHEVVSSRKATVTGNCTERWCGLATLWGALTGKDGTERGGARVEERVGRER